jgi:hypothetical protein
MTRHRKATKADKKSRGKRAKRKVIHDGQSTTAADRPSATDGERHRPPAPRHPADAPSERHENHDALAVSDADQLLRRTPRTRATPIGPPLGDHIEATAD